MLFHQRLLYYRSFVLLGLLICALGFTGCGPGGDQPDAGPEGCQSNSDCTGGKKCRSKKCVLPANVPPNADAGSDQTVKVNEKVLLDGINSFDEDGDDIKFSWSISSKPEGSEAKLGDATSSQPFFTPDKAGKYTIVLEVTDTKDTSKDEVVITAEKGENFPPEAKIAPVGKDGKVGVGVDVLLDGSGSTDANNDKLNFKWTLTVPTGSTATLSDDAAEKPTFKADIKGTYEVSLVVNDGEVDSKPATVSIEAIEGLEAVPQIAEVTPATAPADTITEVTIKGTEFVDGAVVVFRNRDVLATFVSKEEIKAKLELIGVPPQKYPLVVKNPNNESSKPFDFEVIPVPTPAITQLSPNKAGAGSKFTLTITGSGFVQASKVFFTGRELPSTLKSDTTIEAQIDLTGVATGLYPITIQNPGGKSSNSSDFEVTPPPPPPEITIMNPDTGKQGSKIKFTVFGKRFDAKTVILFDGKPIPTKLVVGGELAADPELDLTNIKAGSYEVKVRDQFGIESTPETFTVTDQYPTPVVSSVTPATGFTGSVAKVTIAGRFFDPNARVLFDGKAASKFAFVSDVQMTAEFDLTNVPVSTKTVVVENPGPPGGANPRPSQPKNFTVQPLPPPTITSVSHSPLYAGSQGTILVKGQGFTPTTVIQISTAGQRYSSVTYCRNLTFQDRTTTYISPTEMRVTMTFPANTSSLYRYFGIRAKRGTTLSSAICLYVQYYSSSTPPTANITSLNPVAVTAGTSSPVTVLIGGSGFDINSSVSFNKKPVASVVYKSTSQLEAKFDITGLKAGDVVDVQVENGYGKKSAVAKFSILKQGQPVLSSVSPGSLYAGTTTNLTLRGTGFDSKAAVHADGKPIVATSVTFNSATQITVAGYKAPTGAAKTINIEVVNPNNNKSNPFGLGILLYPAPSFTSHSPTSAANGSSTTVYAYGSNFRSGAKIRLDGKDDYPCTYSNSGRLYCYNVPVLKCPQGPLNVQVVNPDGQVSSQTRTITMSNPTSPRLTSISPTTGVNNLTKLRITLRGSYFSAVQNVLFGTDSYKVTQFSSSGTMYLDIDLTKYKQGIYPVLVELPLCGQSYKSTGANFIVVDPPTPTISYFNQMYAETGTKPTVTVVGTNFNSGSKIIFNGKAETTTYSSTTSLRFTPDLTSVMAGRYTLQVDNGTGKKSDIAYFNVVDTFAPEITRINPAGVLQSLTNTTVTIEGRNFSPNVVVTLKGSTLALSSKTSTRLQFSAPFPSQLYANASKNEIKVTNPGGKSASAFLYVYDTTHPVITYTSPYAPAANSRSTLYVYGYNLNGSTLYYDGAVLSSYNTSSTRIYSRTSVSYGASRDVNIYVTRSGKTSNVIVLPVGASAAPTLNYTNPVFGKAGAGVTLTLSGSGFSTSPMAKVYFDGKAYTPTGSSTTLTVTIPATAVTAGTKEVWVENANKKTSPKVIFNVLP